MTKITQTLSPGLDHNGDGYYTFAEIPDASDIVQVWVIGKDPTASPAGFTPPGVFPQRIYPVANKLVVEGGQPGWEYGVVMHVLGTLPAHEALTVQALHEPASIPTSA